MASKQLRMDLRERWTIGEYKEDGQSLCVGELETVLVARGSLPLEHVADRRLSATELDLKGRDVLKERCSSEDGLVVVRLLSQGRVGRRRFDGRACQERTSIWQVKGQATTGILERRRHRHEMGNCNQRQGRQVRHCHRHRHRLSEGNRHLRPRVRCLGQPRRENAIGS